MDGSETLAITIADVPTGASLSAGTDNGDGTWSITQADLTGLTITPPADSDADFTLKVTATATEADGGDTASSTVNLAVTVDAVADTPTVTVTNATGDEDTAIALDISAVLGDADGSESLAITIADVPAGASLSAGTDNGDGTWSLTQADLTGLTITPPADSDADFTLKVTATATEPDGGDTASSTVNLAVTVDAVADTPTVTVTNATGDEDTAIALDISAALADTDGSETLAITVADVPTGAALSAGTDNGDGTWSLTQADLTGLTITPPADSDADFTLKVTATATEADGGDTASSTVNFAVTVDAVADTPTLSVDANKVQGEGFEEESLPDNSWGVFSEIPGWKSDMGGGIEVQKFGEGTNGGQIIELDSTSNSNMYQMIETTDGGLYTLQFDYSPRRNVSADSNPIQVWWNGEMVAEATGDGVGQPGNIATAWETHEFELVGDGNPVRLEFRAVGTEDSLGGLLDNIRFNESGISGLEDEWISLEITAALRDTDGSETLTVTVADMPAGAELSVGTNNGDGTWTLTGNQLDNVMLRAPANDDGDFTLRFTATATEAANGDQASTSADYMVRIGAVADAPTLSVTAATGDADSAIALDITAALTDLDGSESLSIEIGGVPAGATLSAGTNTGSGIWSLAPADLPGLTITPPAGDDADFSLSVTARATEGANGDIASTSTMLPVTVNDLPANQDPSAVNDAASTTEETSKVINILGNDFDLDGDILSVTNATDPANGSVVLNPDNTVTYTPDRNFTGSDSFSYTISDGNGGTATATVDLVVDSFDRAITGTRRSDNISGSNGKDYIRGRGGNDRIDGGGDDDLIEAGSGNDLVLGGSGDDTLFGDRGNDTMYGGDGDNYFDGGRDRDTMYGGSGNDRFDGGSGDDRAFGFDGDDTYVFRSRDGDDTFDGGTGGGWTDAIVLENVNTGPGGGDWTLQLDQGSIVSQSNSEIVLSQDAAGTIVMDDGSRLDFSGVETLTW